MLKAGEGRRSRRSEIRNPKSETTSNEQSSRKEGNISSPSASILEEDSTGRLQTGHAGSGKIAVTARLEELAARIRLCTECPLHASRTIAVPGEGKVNARVMIIGEAPGRQEDQTGRPFVGSAGKYLDQVIAGTGFERADVFITNTVKCRPPANRTPRVKEVDTCTSLYLFEQIQLINPKLVLLLGGVAVKKLLGLKSVEEARGRIIEHDGRKYFASYHPAARFYREDLAAKIQEDFALLRHELERL